jgi:hypothetical protein
MGIDLHIHYQYIITMASTFVMANDHYNDDQFGHRYCQKIKIMMMMMMMMMMMLVWALMSWPSVIIVVVGTMAIEIGKSL